MVRSAAKNHARVTVLCDPGDYARVLDEILLKGTRRRGRAQTWPRRPSLTPPPTTRPLWISLIARGEGKAQVPYPRYLTLPFERAYGLRYGENPHQRGAFYVDRDAAPGSLGRAESVGAGGRELSFNNLVDVDAALDAVREFDRPAAVVVKHTNPCGVAIATTLVEAYRAAREARRAERLRRYRGAQPRGGRGYGQDPRGDLSRVCRCPVVFEHGPRRPSSKEKPPPPRDRRMAGAGACCAYIQAGWRGPRGAGPRRHGGRGGLAGEDCDEARAHRRRRRSGATEFAWRVCKHVKSNAIVLARGEVTVGIGAGQMSRSDFGPDRVREGPGERLAQACLRRMFSSRSPMAWRLPRAQVSPLSPSLAGASGTCGRHRGRRRKRPGDGPDGCEALPALMPRVEAKAAHATFLAFRPPLWLRRRQWPR